MKGINDLGSDLEMLRRTKKTSGKQKKIFLKFTRTEHIHGLAFMFLMEILTARVCFFHPLNIIQWVY
jgi:hypothetical protein